MSPSLVHLSAIQFPLSQQGSSLDAVGSTSSGGTHSSWAMVLVGVLFLLIGGLQAAKPDLGWKMSRWQYRNRDALQPSSAGLIAMRLTGAVAAVIGVVLIVVGLSK